MSRRLQHELSYDAPPDAVAAMLADRTFREEVCDFMGVLRHDVTIVDVGAGMHVTIDQWQPTSGVPSFAQKFVGAETNIVQREIWTTEELGDIHVTIPGKPGEMSGTARLTERQGGTVEVVDMTIKVGIPLLGGKLEDFISGMLLKALKAENKVGRDYLSR